MGRPFKSEVQIVQVRTDDQVRGVARREYWAAAAAPEQALMLVLAAVPEGWAVCLSDPPQITRMGSRNKIRRLPPEGT